MLPATKKPGSRPVSTRIGPSPPAALVDLLCLEAQVERPHLVVDLGSGTGLSTRPWADRADEVVGVEASPEMRAQAQEATAAGNVRFVQAYAQATGLPDECAEIVTCSQAMHWMEPEPTLAEAARILRPGGVFAAYDYDWPPIVHWEIEAAFEEMLRRLRVGRRPDGERMRYAKEEHLERIRSSGHFRYAREIVLHSRERGGAERVVGMALSLGPLTVALENGTSGGRAGCGGPSRDGAARARRPRGGHLPRLSSSTRCEVRGALRGAALLAAAVALLSACSDEHRANETASTETRTTTAPTRAQDVAWVVNLGKWEDHMSRRGSRATQVADGVRRKARRQSELELAVKPLEACVESLDREVGAPRVPRYRESYGLFRTACSAVAAWGRALDEGAGSGDARLIRNVEQKESRVGETLGDAQRELESSFLAVEPLPIKGGNVSTSRIEPRFGRAMNKLVYKREDAAQIEVRCWSKEDWPKVKFEWGGYAGNVDFAGFAYGRLSRQRRPRVLRVTGRARLRA